MRTAKRKSITLAWVGALAVALMLAFVIAAYVLSNFAPQQRTYKTGVHFRTAAGLDSGAQVFFSGMDVGTVDSVSILPDNSIEAVLTIKSSVDIPVRSTFLIATPFTGAASVVITPPLGRGQAYLPHSILPIGEQPIGVARVTLADLMLQGQTVAKRVPVMFGELQARRHAMLASLRSAESNENAMRYEMLRNGTSLSGTLAAGIHSASLHTSHMRVALNGGNLRNRQTVGALTDSLRQASDAMSSSAGALRAVSTDPQYKSNARAAASNMRIAVSRMAEITQSLRQIATDPQTKSQLRDVSARLQAVRQKLASLLGKTVAAPAKR
jgi:phospholipid/cholesterol/gamma-HCH transport system substrate-binding protein